MSISKATRIRVYNKYEGHCAYCGCSLTYKQMHIDHIIPQTSGGTDNEGNLNPACKECNNYKFAYSLEMFRDYLKQMLNERLDYLFKSKTKMQIAINIGVIKLQEWDGLFYFEKKQLKLC